VQADVFLFLGLDEGGDHRPPSGLYHPRIGAMFGGQAAHIADHLLHPRGCRHLGEGLEAGSRQHRLAAGGDQRHQQPVDAVDFRPHLGERGELRRSFHRLLQLQPDAEAVDQPAPVAPFRLDEGGEFRCCGAHHLEAGVLQPLARLGHAQRGDRFLL